MSSTIYIGIDNWTIETLIIVNTSIKYTMIVMFMITVDFFINI